jgi:deoxyribonuclease V
MRSKLEKVEEYEPGLFYYKRELPGILSIVDRVNLSEISCIIVDGHVKLAKDKSGLGEILFDRLDAKVPVIGVAKRSYHTNLKFVAEVRRDESQISL